jgi:hypothetical protein
MSRVLSFPVRASGDRDAAYSQARANTEADQRERARRAAANLERFPYLEGKDRIIAARNLWLVLDRVEREHGIKKARVLHEAGQGGASDSTKRLERFALRPEVSGEQALARAPKLTRSVAKYERIAEKAAMLAGLPRNAFLLDLLAGLPKYIASPAAPTVVEPWAEPLSELLNAMGRAIAHRHNLVSYFPFVARHALRLKAGWAGFEHGMDADPTPFDLGDGTDPAPFVGPGIRGIRSCRITLAR